VNHLWQSTLFAAVAALSALALRKNRAAVTDKRPLRLIIRNAYQLQEHALIGGPSWLDADRFDIVAKASADAPAGQTQRSMFLPPLAIRRAVSLGLGSEAVVRSSGA
jgi:uncharacterized protein (TIGR03435 family)